MDTQYLIRKVETCEACEGSGFVQNADWARISQENNDWMQEHGITTFTDEAKADWERRIAETWPYGRVPGEEEPCCECEGEGKIERWVDLRKALDEIQSTVSPHIRDLLDQTGRAPSQDDQCEFPYDRRL